MVRCWVRAVWLIFVAAAAGTVQGAEPDAYIVRYAPGSNAAVTAALVSQRGSVRRHLAARRLLAVNLPEPALAALRARRDVELIEPDRRRFTQAQATPYGIGMVGAGSDGLPELGSHSRKICIMDTGYDLGHEDLPAGAAVDGDDGYSGGCTGGCDTGNWYEDGHGHGTHVSGTIVALDNDRGVVGIHGSTTLPLHMVKVFNNQGNWAYGSDLIAAVDQCLAAGAQIISMSLGGSYSSVAEEEAFADAETAGVLAIAAAGNGGSATLSYPASYDSVMSVAAIDGNRQVASFSQYNSQVEIAAPGVGVVSTLPGNNYAAWDGTSMATPHVSGVAALVWSHHEGCSNRDVRTALVAGAEDLGGPGRDSSYGHGLVDAEAASALLASSCQVAAPPPWVATPLTNGVAHDIPLGAHGDEFQLSFEVPVGASDLRFVMSGGGGDADLYVRFGAAPAPDVWDCRPWINGNSEACVEPTPNPGTWHVMVRGYTSFSDVSVTASYVDPGAGVLPLYFHPDADLPVQGTVSGSYADLGFNDGVLQIIREVATGGKKNATSQAEHVWRIPGVVGGESVTLRLVAAGEDHGEQDNFIFERSEDGGASWTELVTLPLGGALKTYSIALPADTRGEVLIRARDADRTPRNTELERLWVDQLEIVSMVGDSGSPPTAPTLLSATADTDGVSLAWSDNSDNELGFEIWRAMQSGSDWSDPVLAGQTSADTEAWLDSGVDPDTTYRYQVAAFTTGDDAFSGTLEVTTLPAEEPTLTLTANGYKEKGRIIVDLSWSGAANVDIYRTVNGTEAQIEDGYVGVDYTDLTGLKGGPVLVYRVCAAGSADCSEPVTLSF